MTVFPHRVLLSVLVFALGCGRIRFDPPTANDAITSDVITGDVTTGAIGVVQSTSLATIQIGISLSVAFPDPPTPGDLVVVYVWSWGNNPGSDLPSNGVADNVGNTYLRAVSVHATNCDALSEGAAALYYTANVGASGPLSIMVTPIGGTNQELAMLAIEYYGLAAVPLDVVTAFTTPGTAPPFTFGTGVTPMTTADHELVTSVGNFCGGTPGIVAWTETSGFTIRAMQSTTASLEPGIAADKIVTARGAYVDNWTVDYVGVPYPGVGALATFK